MIKHYVRMERHAGEVTSQERAKPCRACTDFKSWVHIQKSKPLVDEQSNKRNTRVEEVKVAEQVQSSPTAELHSMVEVNIQEEKRKECPLDKDELGRSTWNFLHTMAAYYPEKPSEQDQNDMKNFLRIFSKFYPCSYCAEDFKRDLEVLPPVTENRHALSQWLCQIHNIVNEKVGKPIFDCSKVDERWLTGPKNGYCDY
ncbi:FAD-linked sulfhydryl oxidase ALR-like isoform X2 [Artemia franciscana]|uniref:FAD-linked sulfhydryl oxidase ALR-like isoform X2 n=1 Tax=Artemia franciscana TaxID=6661 RepID=UPI0032DACFF9